MRPSKLFLISCFPLALLAYPDGSRNPTGNAGEPGTGTPCASCHRVALNPAGGKVELTLPSGSTYRAGEKQSWTVRITDPNSNRRYGFQLTASSGSFTAGSNTVVNTSAAKPYVNQRSSSTTYTFDWTPPANASNDVTIYLAGAACAGRNDTNVYTLSQTISAATALPAIKSDSGVVSAASYSAGVVPGAWITIFGENLAPAGTVRAWRGDEIVDGNLPKSLDGTSVKINGKEAALAYISPSQINVLAASDDSAGPVTVQVTTTAGTSPAITAQMAQQAPALFRFDAENGKYAAAVHADGALAGKPGLYGAAVTLRAASAGNVIQLFGTGFGATEPTAPELKSFTAAYSLKALSSLRVRIGGVDAGFTFAGRTSPGLDQINVQIPALAAGDHKIEVEINGVRSTNDVYLTVN